MLTAIVVSLTQHWPVAKTHSEANKHPARMGGLVSKELVFLALTNYKLSMIYGSSCQYIAYDWTPSAKIRRDWKLDDLFWLFIVNRVDQKVSQKLF